MSFVQSNFQSIYSILRFRVSATKGSFWMPKFMFAMDYSREISNSREPSGTLNKISETLVSPSSISSSSYTSSQGPTFTWLTYENLYWQIWLSYKLTFDFGCSCCPKGPLFYRSNSISSLLKFSEI